jgi:hypothetical protein
VDHEPPILLNGMLQGPQGLYGNFERKKDLHFQRGIKMRMIASSTRTLVAILTELTGLPHVTIFLILISRLALYPQSVLCTKRYVLLTSSGAAALTDRRNVTVRSKDCFRMGREKLSEI